MKSTDLNKYIDYIGIFKHILNKHRENYSTIDDYLGNYLCGEFDEIRAEFSKILYTIVINQNNFENQLTVNYEGSILVNEDLQCEIWFEECYDENHYHTYRFLIDLNKECFADFWFN